MVRSPLRLADVCADRCRECCGSRAPVLRTCRRPRKCVTFSDAKTALQETICALPAETLKNINVRSNRVTHFRSFHDGITTGTCSPPPASHRKRKTAPTPLPAYAWSLTSLPEHAGSESLTPPLHGSVSPAVSGVVPPKRSQSVWVYRSGSSARRSPLAGNPSSRRKDAH